MMLMSACNNTKRFLWLSVDGSSRLIKAIDVTSRVRRCSHRSISSFVKQYRESVYLRRKQGNAMKRPSPFALLWLALLLTTVPFTFALPADHDSPGKPFTLVSCSVDGD